MVPRVLPGLFFTLLAASQTEATPLTIVEVNAPAVNCVFNTACELSVTDTTADIPIPVSGTHLLQSRTFTGGPGAPAAGLNGYEYRIDLSQAMQQTGAPRCITSMTVHVGPVVPMDYNGDGSPFDHVYVITTGGLGTVAPSSAVLDTMGNLSFAFNPPVCAGTTITSGQSSFFFGLAAVNEPQAVSATLTDNSGASYSVAARSPNTTLGCTIPGFMPAYWNDSGTIQFNNNCYNYGNNERTDTYAQPGKAAGAQYAALSCPAVSNAATADGLLPSTATAACPAGMDKVAMVVDPGTDYHWYRQGNDGLWTHKPGGSEATNLDNSGNVITNPESANRCGAGLCYSDFCGYFCTCSDEQQGQGHANIR